MSGPSTRVRRALPVALLVLSTCKGGLYLESGNDFPCDFSAPVEVRDDPCAPGEVCGVNNLCRAYRYEGPQFEGGATEPRFDAPVVLHPGPLGRPVTALTHRFDRDGGAHGVVLMGSGTSATLAVLDLGRFTQVRTQPFPKDPEQIQSLAMPGLGTTTVPLLAMVAGDKVLAGPIEPLSLNDLGVNGADRVRPGFDRLSLMLRFGFPGAVEADAGSGFAPVDIPNPDGGVFSLRPIELRYLPPQLGALTRDDTLVLTREGFYLRRVDDGGFELISAPGTTLPPGTGNVLAGHMLMRSDTAGTVISVTQLLAGRSKVLSTWRIDRGPSPTIVRLWPDCTPCKNRIAAFTPTFDHGAPAVEVLCTVAVDGKDEALGARLELIRVVGSAAADESQFCSFESLEAPFDLGQVNLLAARRADERDAGAGVQPAWDEAFGSGVALGGKRGQVWSGASFSDALPVFLDRVPIAFGLLPSLDGGVAPAGLTDRYAAMPRAAGVGFQTIDFRKGAANELAEGVVGAALIGQALGWAILSSGDVAQIVTASADGKAQLLFGPRLLDSHGAAAPGPYFGEAATGADGGVVSFVLTADDSLYFTPSFAATPGQQQLPALDPQLTPQPSSPIRSFALERSAVGTNGIDRIRAYAVAGQSLFLITLAGTPPRWSATEVFLQGGEPVEVWMDHPLGGLARVGYRTGQVFTLPGGFLLVNELPRGEGATPPRVLDYENLGGWPVALTSVGLFEAHYPVVGGHLQNRFPDGGINRPMSWQRVLLPDGGEPWLGKSARLQVWQDTDPQREDSGVSNAPPVNTIKVFRLLVYTDEQVIEVGTLRRR